uniref:ARAD1C19030p n=1 Tax=Blastobotrys adeninivorans TaxID=409370 RepID=A0A060T778_BLAAD
MIKHLAKVGSLFSRPGRGVYHDVKARLPYYVSDWTDGLNYRVVPATVFMYFANLLPTIAFAQDLFDRTDNAYGVNEVLLGSAMGGIVFGLFAGQPLCVVGVTGPIAIFNYTVYEIMTPRGTPYFPFMAWVCLWSMVMHIIIALFNWVNLMRYVTRYACDIFGFFICFVYIQKGIQLLTRQFDHGTTDEGYLSVVVALCVMIFGMLWQLIGQHSHLFWGPIRTFFADYGTPLTVVFFSGFVHFGHRLGSTTLQNLPTGGAFTPTTTMGGREHGWFIHFWEISVADVFLAIPFAILLTVLFYFDHNVSSLICQGSEFPLKKPASFHWDFLLLGITTGVAGILGIPPPNGLIPQAPLHTMSLCVTKTRVVGPPDHPIVEKYVDSVVEQRVSNFAQGLLILGTMSGPLLTVLGLVPQGVLAGQFWIMGITGLMGNAITSNLRFIFTEKKFYSPRDPLQKVQKWWLYLYVLLELIAFGAEFGITQTVAAVGFPGVLMASLLIGWLMPFFFPKSDIEILDGPQADEFILKNLSFDDNDNNGKHNSDENTVRPTSSIESYRSAEEGLRRRHSKSFE